MNTNVTLRTLESFDIELIEGAVRECFADMNIERILRPKMTVLLKVGVPQGANPDQALTTHPSIVRGVINVLADLDVNVVVADSPYGKFNENSLEEIYLNTGMIEVANSSKCELNRDLSTATLYIPNGIRSRSVQILDVVNKADIIINLGKIKIDEKLGFLGVAANMFGIIPGDVKTQIIKRTDNLKDFNNYIIDIIDALEDKLVLNIADAVVAVEKGNTQRMLSCLGMSTNPYALDATFIKMIGMELKHTIIKQAHERSKINIDTPFKMVGEKLDKFIVNDFAFYDFDEDSKLNRESELQRKVYFNNNIQHVVINPKACKGCTVCSKMCPANAILMKYDKKGELYAEVDYQKCIYCNQCKLACPYSVIDIKTPFGHNKIQRQIQRLNNKEDT